MDKTIWIALIGTIGPLMAAGVLLLSHVWTKDKNKAEAQLVTANTLTVVIDGLKAELQRVSDRVDALETDLEEERRLRGFAQDLERAARMELTESEHRFGVLVEHHTLVVTVANDAGVDTPHPPPLLLPYLGPEPTE